MNETGRDAREVREIALNVASKNPEESPERIIERARQYEAFLNGQTGPAVLPIEDGNDQPDALHG